MIREAFTAAARARGDCGDAQAPASIPAGESRRNEQKNNTLGSLIRGLRRQKWWTLWQMRDKVGIPLSTLAKVEQDKLSLTYDKLHRFTSRLGLTMTEFLAQNIQWGYPARAGSQCRSSAARRADWVSRRLRRRPPRWSPRISLVREPMQLQVAPADTLTSRRKMRQVYEPSREPLHLGA